MSRPISILLIELEIKFKQFKVVSIIYRLIQITNNSIMHMSLRKYKYLPTDQTILTNTVPKFILYSIIHIFESISKV